jgi:hypothetical protein
MSNTQLVAKIVRTFVRGTSAEQRLTVRAGANGTGKAIHSCLFWPHSSPSISAAHDQCHAAAEQAGYTILMDSED